MSCVKDAHPPVRGIRPRLWALLPVLCLAATACVTIPLDQRSWQTLSSEHYDFLSSLGPETEDLAKQLEAFRAAAEAVWGTELRDAPIRTRVFAFDGRGAERPFGQGAALAYLIPSASGDILVFRGGGGWDDVRTEWKLAYARRLFWNSSPRPRPPWFEEGLAQVASTLRSWPGGASVGVVQEDHVRRLRGTNGLPLRRVVSTDDLRGFSRRERELFEAESWAAVHYLQFHEENRSTWSSQSKRLRGLAEQGAGVAFRSVWGPPDDLDRPVWGHVRQRELPFLDVRIEKPGPVSALQPADDETLLAGLGELSLALGRHEQALGYFEDALEIAPERPRLLSGRGRARHALGQRAEALADFEAARTQAPDDPWLTLAHADAQREGWGANAGPGSDPAARASVRRLYEATLARDGRITAAHLGLAATYLEPGEDPALGLGPVRRAQALLPADFEVTRVAARLALAAGDANAAAAQVRRLHSRARSDEEIEIAASLLRDLETRTD